MKKISEWVVDWGALLFVVGFIIFLGCLIGGGVWWSISDERDFERRCAGRGGHVIHVESTSLDDARICVDDGDKVLLV